MGCPAKKSRAAQAPVSSPRSVTIRPKTVCFKERSGQRHLSMPLKKAPADAITTAATYYKEKGVGMPRSNMLSRLLNALRVAQYAEQHKLSTIDAQERLAELAYRKTLFHRDRRDFLKTMTGAAVITAGALAFPQLALAKRPPRVAIVGAGFSGLACAYYLRKHGYPDELLEENAQRIGGREASSSANPGKVVVRGGEWIDSGHTTVRRLAKEFGLELEDRMTLKGDSFFYHDGALHKESELVDEFRQFLQRIKPDVDALDEPIALKHTDAERELDLTDLATYLDRHANDLPLARSMLNVAYTIEFGLETPQLSALALLSMVELEPSENFKPFGASDERFHVVQGNDQIAKQLAERASASLQAGAALERLRRNASGKFELYFKGAATPEIADAVVMAIPFSVLRNVVLEDNLDLSKQKRRAIAELRYGNNAKTMIAFEGRPWATEFRNNGETYADLPNVQNVWETYWRGRGPYGVRTDIAGGDRGRRMQLGSEAQPLFCQECHVGPGIPKEYPAPVQSQTDEFLKDFDKVMPGIKAKAVKKDGHYLVVRGHWLPQRTALGSYTANHPGYFTTFAWLEAQAAGLLKFAGEHTSSFYEAQRNKKNTCTSGIAAAKALVDDIRYGRL